MAKKRKNPHDFNAAWDETTKSGRLEAEVISLRHQVIAWKSIALALTAKEGRRQAKKFISKLRS